MQKALSAARSQRDRGEERRTNLCGLRGLLARVRLVPLEEVLIELVAIAEASRNWSARGEELVETLAPAAFRGLLVVLLQPFFGWLEALPAREFRRQIDFLPLRMAWLFLEFRHLGEEEVDEFRKAAIALGVLRPVVSDHHRRIGDCIDALPLIDQARIVVVVEARRQIILAQLRRVGDWQQAEVICGRQSPDR